jgi:hypothetical protein
MPTTLNPSDQTITQYSTLVGAASNLITNIGPSATSNQVFQSGGSSANPAWSTATYPATTTINQILYSSAANTVSGLATGNNGVLITSATGVPSLLADGTTGQVLTATTGSPPSWGAAGGTITNGTFTPGITIGGSSTGITYTTQSGFYSNIGGNIFVNGFIALSSIGGLSGTILVTGLPVTTGASATQFALPIANFNNAATFALAEGIIFVLLNTTATTGTIYYSNFGSKTYEVLPSGVFSNTTAFSFQGIYQVV